MTSTEIQLKILYAKITLCQEVIGECMQNIPDFKISAERQQRINRLSKLIGELEKQAQRLKRGRNATASRIRNKRLGSGGI